MFVCALRVELFFPSCHSLKEKRAIVRPVCDGLRNRFSVSVAEVGFQDKWQRSTIGIAMVSGAVDQINTVLDGCERFIWSFPELEVTNTERVWLDE
jgi:uncharacterized protein